MAKGFRVRPWVTVMPRRKRPEQTRTKATRSRWAGSMLAWTLKTIPLKSESIGRGSASASSRGDGAGAVSAAASSSSRTPKLVRADP